MEHGRYFHEIETDESGDVPGRTITEADVLNQATVSGNFHPVHVDEEFAREQGHEERRVQPLLLLNIGVGLGVSAGSMVENPHANVAGLESVQSVTAVTVGDTVELHWEVVDKEVESEAYGTVTTHGELRNQDGETVLVYDLLERVERETDDE